MSYRDWYVGMPLVCIRDLRTHWVGATFPCTVPEKDGVYTLREIFSEHRLGTDPDRLWIRLVEIVNAPADTAIGPYEAAFSVAHFRPVEAPDADISVFRAMLNPKRERERA